MHAETNTPRSTPQRVRCKPGESASNALYMLANIVSPPLPGTSSAYSIEGGIVVGMIGMPDTADVHFVVGFLQHHRHLGLFRHGREEPVDVDVPEPLRSRKLSVGMVRIVGLAPRLGSANAQNATDLSGVI